MSAASSLRFAVPLLLVPSLACDGPAAPEPALATTTAEVAAPAAPPAAAAPPDNPEAKARALFEASPFAAQADILAAALRPHVRLHPARKAMADIPTGASRLAGQPDLPPGFAWPTHGPEPMALLAQIDLAELAPHAPQSALPASGWLYFFWAVDSGGWGYTAETAGSFAVHYHQGPVEELTRTEPPAGLPQWAQDFAPCTVAFEPGVALPGWQDLRYPKALDLSQDIESWYELSLRVMGVEPPGETVHHLLGHPQLVQGDPRPQAVKRRGGEPDDWNLLLQLETDTVSPNWMWGDVGTVYFLIRDQDLEARAFDQAWLVAQGH